MARTVKLNETDALLSDLDYPVSREAAIDEYDDVTLSLADGEANMSEVLDGSSAERFDSADELESELMNLLPRNAVGEPYQSEGEG
ncbi:DUF5789 family protein [Halostella litorea]|uniref:DUF5789 family protein n=1 Tax=Halostella litorea TaxID=2528831 RepID=UPI0010922DAB|nr:hypothetical protein [Halostella litorea]